jgi:hypothetical protein
MKHMTVKQWVDKIWNDCRNYDYEHRGDWKLAIENALIEIDKLKLEDEEDVFDCMSGSGYMHQELAELEKNLLLMLREVNYMVSRPKEARL